VGRGCEDWLLGGLRRRPGLKRGEEGWPRGRADAVGGVINTDSGWKAAETQRQECRCHRGGVFRHPRGGVDRMLSGLNRRPGLKRGEEGHRGCGGGWALVGKGSSSYIVVVIMRDEDANTLWDAAVEGDDVIVFAAAWDGGHASTAWAAGGGLPAGAGQHSVTSGNRIGYAGYRFDLATEQYHVRHRVYSPEMGRWTRRDSIELPIVASDSTAVCRLKCTEEALERRADCIRRWRNQNRLRVPAAAPGAAI
jgi:RHS repeat-associated protein